MRSGFRMCCLAALAAGVVSWSRGQVPERVQMAYNYCTLSYTMALWSENDWEAEIDRLANAGFTHVLVNAGMEEVWYRFLTEKLGAVEGFANYTDAEARAHIPHPAWRAWWLMGNLEGEGRMLSPDGKALSREEIKRQARIGQAIVRKCQARGMTPVLNAFMGLLPTNFSDKYPALSYLPQTSAWCSYTRPDQLLPTDARFPALAKAFHEALFEVYDLGTWGAAATAEGSKPLAFSGDLFHEGGATPSDNATTTASAKAVQAAQQAARPGAVWFLQHWQTNPTAALLKGCDADYTIVQCLDKDMRASSGTAANAWAYTDGEGNRIPWVWAELTNFGDNPNLYGSLARMKTAKDYLASGAAGTTRCVGWGILDEGISYQPVYYAQMFDILGTRPEGVAAPAELAIPTRPDAKGAWDRLLDSVYAPTAFQEGCTEGILCAEPHFGLSTGHASAWGTGGPYYSKRAVRRAAESLLGYLEADSALAQDDAWREFYIDVMRQVASDAFTDKPELRKPELFATLDALLLRSNRWTLWHYWQRALELSRPVNADGALGEANEADALRHYRNYLCLMTIWKQGDTGNVSKLHDYSHRHLGGMMEAYYGRRWRNYWEGQTQAAIRATDAAWWKTAPIPTEAITPTAEDLVRIGREILAYDITAGDRKDATGFAPTDWYDFVTADAANKGTSGRAWDTTGGSFALVNDRNDALGAVTGSRWSAVGQSLRDGTLSLVSTLGATANGVLFSTGKGSGQWAIRRKGEAGKAELAGIFTEPLPLDYGTDEEFRHLVVSISGGGAEVRVWLDGTLVDTTAFTVAEGGVPSFSAYQVNGIFGGGGSGNTLGWADVKGTGAIDDLRLYDAALTETQVADLHDELWQPALNLLDWYSFDTPDEANRGSSGRAWAGGSFSAADGFTVEGGGATGGAVTGSKWSTTADASLVSKGYTVSLLATLGKANDGVVFSTGKATNHHQWALKRGTEPGKAELKGLFTESFPLDYGADDAFRLLTVAIGGGASDVRVWLDGERLDTTGYTPKGNLLFVGYQLNDIWGGAGSNDLGLSVKSTGAIDDFRIYDASLANSQVKAIAAALLSPMRWWEPSGRVAEDTWSNALRWGGAEAPLEGNVGVRVPFGSTTLTMDASPALSALTLRGDGALTLKGEPFTAETLAVEADADIPAGMVEFETGAVTIATGKTLTVNDAATVPLTMAGAMRGEGTLRIRNEAFARAAVEADEATLSISDGSILTLNASGGASSVIHKTLWVSGNGKVAMTAENVIGWNANNVDTSIGSLVHATDHGTLEISAGQVVHYPIELSGNATLNYTRDAGSNYGKALKINKGCIVASSGAPTVTGTALGVHETTTELVTLFDVHEGASLFCDAAVGVCIPSDGNYQGRSGQKVGKGLLVLRNGFVGTQVTEGGSTAYRGVFTLAEGGLRLAGEASFAPVLLNSAVGTTLDLGTVRTARLGSTLAEVTVTPTDAELEAGSLTLTTQGELAALLVSGAKDVTQSYANGTLTVSFVSALAKWEAGAWTGLPTDGTPAVATVAFSEGHAAATVPDGTAFESLSVVGEGALEGSFTVNHLMLAAGASLAVPMGALPNGCAVEADAASTLVLRLGGKNAVFAPLSAKLGALTVDTEGTEAQECVTLNLSAELEVSTLTLEGAAPLTLEGVSLRADALNVGVSADIEAGLVTFGAGKVTVGEGATLTVNDAATVPLTPAGSVAGTGALCIRNAAFSRQTVLASEPALEIGRDSILTMNHKNAGTTAIHRTVTVSGNGKVIVTADNVGGWDPAQTESLTLFSLRDEASVEFNATEVLTQTIELADNAMVRVAKAGGIILKNGRIHATGGTPSILAGDPAASLSLQHLTEAGGLAVEDGATLTLGVALDMLNKALTVGGAGRLAVERAVTPGTLTFTNGTVAKTGAGEATLACVPHIANLHVEAGSLTLKAGGTYSGTLSVDEGAALVVDTGAAAPWNEFTDANAEHGVTVNGTVEFRSGALAYRALLGAGTVVVSGDTNLPNTGDAGAGTGLKPFRGDLVVNPDVTLSLTNWNQPYRTTLRSLTVNGSVRGVYGNVNASHEIGFTVGALSGIGTVGANLLPLAFASGATLDATSGAPTLVSAPTVTDTVTVKATACGPVLKAPGVEASAFVAGEGCPEGIFCSVTTPENALALVQKPKDAEGGVATYDDNAASQIAACAASNGCYSDYAVSAKTHDASGAERTLTADEVDAVLACFSGEGLLQYMAKEGDKSATVSVNVDFGIVRTTVVKDGEAFYVRLAAKAQAPTSSGVKPLVCDASKLVLMRLSGDPDKEGSPMTSATLEGVEQDDLEQKVWFRVPLADLTADGATRFGVRAVTDANVTH